MKKFTFYYYTANGETQAVIEASNQGIALSRFKQLDTGCLKIKKIEKEKKQKC